MRTKSLLVLLVTLCAILLAAALSAASQDGAPQCQEGPDTTALMQGNVRVDILGRLDLPSSAKHGTAKAIPSSPSSSLPSKVTPSHTSPQSSPQVPWTSKATSGISLLVGTLQTHLQSSLPIVLVSLLLIVAVLIACLVIYPQLKQANTTSSGQQPAERERMIQQFQRPPAARGSPSAARVPLGDTAAGLGANRPSTSAFSDRGGGQAPGSVVGGRVSDFMVPQPSQPPTQITVPSVLSLPSRPQLAPLSKQAPPALCPTLVMPVCEARFGVPMNDVARLGVEGEISIVGLSGNPLLRARLQLDRNRQRTLEICMPERNSAPRATIAPYSGGDSSGGYEIRGMKGSFYGFLHMQTTGTCYVVKDGQTVLLLDGDTEALQLAVKSGAGAQLASVRCSAEPFGGVDHVEIRVEPGVDTVLVLAVVLGVLLLSDR